MATLTRVPDASHNAITSPHLRLAMFGRLDKDHFVKAYVQSQSLHATTYATDGRALLSNRNRQTSATPVKQKDLAFDSKHYGFDTPVLKPRVAKQTDTSVAAAEHVSDVDINEHEPVPVKKVQPRKPSRPSTKSKKTSSTNKKENVPLETNNNKPLSKKRVRQVDSDGGDHAIRLTERRERKRAKRAIIQPKELSFSEDDEHENSFPLPKRKRSETKNDKKNKIPGFALMHGFTATNVGKNRLTLGPGPSAGVFGKGKASVKTQIVQNASKKSHKNVFSEFAFLNQTAKDGPKHPQVQANAPCSQSEHSPTSILSVPTPSPKKMALTNREPSKTTKLAEPCADKGEHHDSLDDRSARKSSALVNKPKKAADGESELWGMEFEDWNSNQGSSSTSPMTCDQPQGGTVVLDTQAIWGGAQIELAADEDDNHKDLNGHCNGADLAFGIGLEEAGCRSSSSICPSESASQCGQPRVLRPQRVRILVPPATSKYFVDVGERTAPYLTEEADISLPMSSDDFLPAADYPTTSLERPMETLPIPRSDYNLSAVTSNGYHNSKHFAAPPPSFDSIDMELQEYMDYTITNPYGGVSLQFGYEGEISKVESDTSDANYNDNGESYVGYPHDRLSEDMNTYPLQQMDPEDFVRYDEPEAEQEAWDGILLGNDKPGFGLCDGEVQHENGIEDSECNSMHEDIQYGTVAESSLSYGNVDDYGGCDLLTQRFSQGRAILLGLSEAGNAPDESSKLRVISHVEATVAKSLREHWLPQKF